jgi:hypothetical protein
VKGLNNFLRCSFIKKIKRKGGSSKAFLCLVDEGEKYTVTAGCTEENGVRARRVYAESV